MCILSYLFSLWLYSIESRWCTLERIGYSMWNAGTWKGDCRPEQTRVFGYWENYTGWLIFWIRNILWRSCVIVANWNIPERFALKIWNWSDGTRWSREFAWRNIEVRHNRRSQTVSGWDRKFRWVCDFNGLSDCKRPMEWSWWDEVFPASKVEAEILFAAKNSGDQIKIAEAVKLLFCTILCRLHLSSRTHLMDMLCVLERDGIQWSWPAF